MTSGNYICIAAGMPLGALALYGVIRLRAWLRQRRLRRSIDLPSHKVIPITRA